MNMDQELIYHQLYNFYLIPYNMGQFIVNILKSYIDNIPRSDEQPGPPFNHKVNGSLLLGPLTD